MKKLILLLILNFSIFASMLEKFADAEPGCYSVFESQKTYTLLHLHSKSDSTVILEEISAPTHAVSKGWDWKSWISKNAPGHTAWTQYEFDLKSGQLLECYSFTRESWLQNNDGLLGVLINLGFKPIAETKRKRIGATPPHHAIDIRPIWNPPKFVHGSQIKYAKFNAVKTRWPKDESEMADKKIILYFDQTGFPFPYWIDITATIDTHIHAIDSGNEMQSPRSHLPRRYPQIIGSYQQQGSLLRLQIKTPLYYKNFNLYNGSKPTACSITEQGDTLYLDIDPGSINPKEPLMLTPDSHPHIFVDLPPLPK
ncbi:MAG TPA: hypothetical protein PLO43_02615 [Chlamydiales bacterium]|nr:hypothetical protein [Chlamydiales bacterium]